MTARILVADGGAPAAVGVVDRSIVAVGTEHEVVVQVGRGAEIRRWPGACLAAGFMDAHHHFALAVLDRLALDVRVPSGAGLDDLLGRLHASSPDQRRRWIRAHSYDPLHVREGRAPHRRELDAVCPDRPLVLFHESFHEAALNSRALEELGWTAHTRDPPDGHLVRDRRGRLTGEVHEGPAFLVEARSREEGLPSEFDAACREHGQRLLSLGIVRVGDAAVPPALHEAYLRAASNGSLPLPIHCMPVGGRSLLEAALTFRAEHPSGRVRSGPAKLFVDGGHRCALCVPLHRMAGVVAGTAMSTIRSRSLQPLRIARRAGPIRLRRAGVCTGHLLREHEELASLSADAIAAEVPLALHAMGDAAATLALDALEAAGADHGRVQHRLEHLALVDPASVAPRLADLGVTGVVQPSFLTIFGPDVALARGPRWIVPFPWASLRAAGARLAGSSDYPVGDPDVLAAIQAAVTRRLPNGECLEMHEALSVREALDLYGPGAAAALGVADETGTLQAGRLADVVVLSHDPERIAPHRIREVAVLATMVEGSLAYERDDATPVAP